MPPVYFVSMVYLVDVSSCDIETNGETWNLQATVTAMSCREGSASGAEFNRLYNALYLPSLFFSAVHTNTMRVWQFCYLIIHGC